MMNAWVRKEAKDILRWTPIGMVILSLVLWSVMRSLGPYTFSELSSNLCFQTVIASAVFGVFLGVASFWFDSNGAARGYLVHRGIWLSRVFFIRTLLGFISFMIAMWTPLLCCGFYISMIGPATLPITPYAIVPSLVVVVFSFGFFFAGSMIVCRASSWFGSRLLPILGAIPLPMAMLSMFSAQVYPFLFTGGLGVAGLYLMWASARSAFLRGASRPAPSQNHRLSMFERAMLLLSTVVATIVLAALITMTTMPINQSWPMTRVAIKFESDGTPWLVELPTNYWNLENPNEQTRVLANLTNDKSDENKPELTNLQYGYELFSRFSALANRFDTWDMTSLGEYREYQLYGNRDLIYLYRKLDNGSIYSLQLIAVIGRKSAGDLQNPPTEKFHDYPVILTAGENFSNSKQKIDSIFLVAPDGVHRFDIQSRTFKQVLPQPIQLSVIIIKGLPIDGSYHSVVDLFAMHDHSISVYETKSDNQNVVFDSEPIAKIDLPRDLDLSNYQSGIFWFQDAKNWTFVPLKFTGNYDQKEFVVVRSKNDTVTQSTITSPVEPKDPSNDYSSRENQELIRVMLLLPPVLVSVASFVSYFVAGETVLWNSLWLLGLFQAIFSGVLCLLAARYRCLSNGRCLLWMLLGALFGLGTWAAMLAIYPRVYRVRCANCGCMRRIENDNCEKCGAAWEPLKPLEIEILSNHTPSPQSQPAA
ncbi:MAG: hypothetical protein MUC83_10920 [Pirellula sp.]|nr:hypothetical protein [Pirellula sp.]